MQDPGARIIYLAGTGMQPRLFWYGVRCIQCSSALQLFLHRLLDILLCIESVVTSAFAVLLHLLQAPTVHSGRFIFGPAVYAATAPTLNDREQSRHLPEL
jgi:hypothetical protein